MHLKKRTGYLCEIKGRLYEIEGRLYEIKGQSLKVEIIQEVVVVEVMEAVEHDNLDDDDDHYYY